MSQSSQSPTSFVTIGPGVYTRLVIASTSISEMDDSGPNVILIFGWLGAETRHLEHYSRKYAELYPRATQIIVKSRQSSFWNYVLENQEQLQPVIETLENLGCIPSICNSTITHPRILVHSFSNGGGFNLLALSHLLSSKHPSISPPGDLVSALVFDSSPSIGNLRTASKAFTISVENPVVRRIGIPLLYLGRGIRVSLETVFGWEIGMRRYFKALINPRLLPWMTIQTPRLYVFSKKDELIPWREVQAHAKAAERAGICVRCELYEESAHVSHARRDPERYWRAVQDLWETARRQNQVKAML